MLFSSSLNASCLKEKKKHQCTELKDSPLSLMREFFRHKIIYLHPYPSSNKEQLLV